MGEKGGEHRSSPPTPLTKKEKRLSTINQNSKCFYIDLLPALCAVCKTVKTFPTYIVCTTTHTPNQGKFEDRSFTSFRMTHLFIAARCISFSNVCHSERSEESFFRCIASRSSKRYRPNFMLSPQHTRNILCTAPKKGLFLAPVCATVINNS